MQEHNYRSYSSFLFSISVNKEDPGDNNGLDDNGQDESGNSESGSAEDGSADEELNGRIFGSMVYLFHF